MLAKLEDEDVVLADDDVVEAEEDVVEFALAAEMMNSAPSSMSEPVV